MSVRNIFFINIFLIIQLKESTWDIEDITPSQSSNQLQILQQTFAQNKVLIILRHINSS